MTYAESLVVIIQDRVNHLESISGHYEVGPEKEQVENEISKLEAILDILVNI